MFYALLIATFVVALAASHLIVRLFASPLDRILTRIIADEISTAWLGYLKFAIYVVGVSKGVRVWDMERYITPSRFDDKGRILDLTAERWFLELYRTAIETLQGIAWMLLVFFIFALFAFVIVRVFELRRAANPDDSNRRQ